MQILVLGGSGLIGRAFAREMLEGGHRVTILSRHPETARIPAGVEARGWDGRSPDGWVDLVERSDALVNLVGENIGARMWTEERKRQILDSRVQVGQVICDALRAAARRPEVLLQASAVGYYGPQKDAGRLQEPEWLTEASPPGTDTMAQVCVRWENSTQPVEELGVRRIIMRSGVVLDAREGILPRFLLPFRLFAGGPIGSGQQGVSWIHLKDQVRAMRFLLEHQASAGIYNLVAPQPLSNAKFGRILAKTIHRPFWLPAPAFALRLALGEMSGLVLEGQYVSPARLLAEGYIFTFPKLAAALADLLA